MKVELEETRIAKCNRKCLQGGNFLKSKKVANTDDGQRRSNIQIREIPERGDQNGKGIEQILEHTHIHSHTHTLSDTFNL